MISFANFLNFVSTCVNLDWPDFGRSPERDCGPEMWKKQVHRYANDLTNRSDAFMSTWCMDSVIFSCVCFRSKWSVKEPTRIHHLKKLEMRLRSVAFCMVKIYFYFVHVPFLNRKKMRNLRNPCILGVVVNLWMFRKKWKTPSFLTSLNVRQPNSGSALLPLWAFDFFFDRFAEKSREGCFLCSCVVVVHETFWSHCCVLSRYLTVQHSTYAKDMQRFVKR